MARDYTSTHFKLWPKGKLHPKQGQDSNLEKLFNGMAVEPERFDDEAKAKLIEAMPDQTGAFLEDWERILGLPLCGQQLPTREERRDMVLAMLNIGPYANLAFFEEIAALFGFDVTAETLKPFRMGSSRMGERLNSAVHLSTIKITGTCIDPHYFRMGSSGMGEPLFSCGNAGLVCILEHFKLSFQYIIYDLT